MEFIETRKLTKKKIRNDITSYNEKLIEEVIEQNRSLKRYKQLSRTGKNGLERCRKTEEKLQTEMKS